MNNIRVKNEFFANITTVPYCHACLSTDRVLSAVNEYIDIFRKLFDNHSIPPDKLLCWECLALLKNVRMFTTKVANAQKMLQLYDPNRQVLFPQSLSTLNTSQITSISTTTYEDVELKPIKMEIELEEQVETLDNFDFQTNNEKLESEPTALNDRLHCKMENTDVKTNELKRKSKEFNVIKNLKQEVKHSFVNTQIEKPRVLLLRKTPINVNKVDRSSSVEVKGDESSGDETSDEDTSDANSVSSVESLERKRPKPETRLISITPTPYIQTEITEQGTPPCEADFIYINVKMTREEMAEWRDKKKRMEFYTSSVFKCKRCIEPFDSKLSYGSHKKRHTEDYGEIICHVCEQRCCDSAALNYHMTTHYSLLKCKYCPHEWDSPNTMRRHCRDAHGVPVTEWECDQCNHRFPSAKKLAMHNRQHRVLVCPECGVLLRSSLKKHMVNRHKELPLRRCTKCDLQFKGDSGLKEHMKRHNKVDDKTFCKECNLQFQNKYVYRSHMKNTLKHAAAKDLRYKCGECDKAFLYNRALVNHRDAVHDKQKKYPCEHCGEAFHTVVARRRHSRAAHEGRGPVKDKICQYCGKGFAIKDLLMQHINSHTGDRPYKCKLCDASFRAKSALYLHGRFVHKIKKKTEQATTKT